MTDSSFEPLDQEPARLATGYLVTDGPPDSWPANVFSVPAAGMPDGGVITTAPDLARLIDALLGGKLLTPATIAAMTTPQGPPSDDLEQYGYGCELVLEGGEVTIIGHGGMDPGVSAMVTHHLRAATTTVVLCNHDRGSWAVTKRLAQELGLTEPRT
jgi:D-alanyl-D-alanine carboxypeptidase